mmetsp:Transcript_17578/g.33363  ORF Transcript_17578/g.33363 Transcript_17578/m.33363 type:complete len:95 (+) Transcript_17578:277-561(+)|eukprot:scaffold2558_cov172-Amphora_coffeaeformis.AAC.11
MTSVSSSSSSTVEDDSKACVATTTPQQPKANTFVLTQNQDVSALSTSMTCMPALLAPREYLRLKDTHDEDGMRLMTAEHSFFNLIGADAEMRAA